MDDTQTTTPASWTTDDLLDQLAAADPAEAPAVAEQVAADLADRLDGPPPTAEGG